MRAVIYFLLIANGIFLFVNWDTITGDETPSFVLKQNSLQSIRLADGQGTSLPIPPSSPQTSSAAAAESLPSDLRGIIRGAWDFLTGLAQKLVDSFSSSYTELPPPAAAPSRPPPCYQLSGYTSLTEVRKARDILALADISSTVLTRDGVREQSGDTRQYQVVAKVRANLDIAKTLSDKMAGQGAVPNKIQKTRSVGYQLVSKPYKTRAAAESARKRLQGIGFSVNLVPIGSSKPVPTTVYLLQIRQGNTWETRPPSINSQLDEKIKVERLPSC